MFRHALISVSDKTNLAEFLRNPLLAGLRIVSTGGTAKYLKEHGFGVTDVSEQTGFPEVFDGRVKTLHPKVHMGILARADHADDAEVLRQFEVDAFDLVIVNLYPFAKAAQKTSDEQILVENIDIGGPTMLRAAAKNHARVTVIVDPSDYVELLKPENQNLQFRKRCALKVFTHTAKYDAAIVQKLSKVWDSVAPLPASLIVHGESVGELRYGENPQQQAVWYRTQELGLHCAKRVQGKALSYNNLLDLDAAQTLIQGFSEPTCVFVKHNNPCGVGQDADPHQALQKAFAADPKSAFGGIVATNFPITPQDAEFLTQTFLECVIAPEISSAAHPIFATKKNLRVLTLPAQSWPRDTLETRSVGGGLLAQKSDQQFGELANWKIVGATPSSDRFKQLIFSERIVAALKSNAIAIVGVGQSIGLGMGQVNRVDAVEQAIGRMQSLHPQCQPNELVLASDAFFPFADSLELVHAAGIRWVLQPGGAMRDLEIFKRAEELHMNLVITGARHFRH